MKRTAPLIVVVATLVVGAFSVSSASAAWTKNVSTTDGKGSATSVGTPGAGSVTSKTDTTMTISWSAPSGIAPTGYEISRGGSVIATCTPSPATATTCTDTGLTASTAYSYTVKAKRNGWTGPANTAFGATTTAPSDSDAPTWSATCPTAGGHYTLGGSGTFASAGTGKCGGKVSGTVADATGISKVEISVQEDSASCWSAASGKFDATCDTFNDVTSSASGATYSLSINQAKMTAGSTYRVKVRTTDTLTNSAVVANYTYSVS